MNYKQIKTIEYFKQLTETTTMKGKHQIVVLVSIVVVTTIVWLFNRRDLSDIVTDNFHGVKRLQINDDYLVETSASHFALASPQLTEQTGWKV